METLYLDEGDNISRGISIESAPGGAYSNILSGPPSIPPVRLKLLTRILPVAGVYVQLILTLLSESTTAVPCSTATGTPIDQGKRKGKGGGRALY